MTEALTKPIVIVLPAWSVYLAVLLIAIGLVATAVRGRSK